MTLSREPLLHFLAIGAVIFVLYELAIDPLGSRPDQIIVSAGRVEQIVQGWRKTWQRPPTVEELEGLIENFVREEILYREALALGLDRDDIIVRRRLRQKMEFLSESLFDQAEPSDEQLHDFMANNPASFRTDTLLTFSQIYLNQDRRGESAGSDAIRLLARLAASKDRVIAAALGDPLPLPMDFDALPEREVVKLFGQAFAARLREIEPGSWTGPVESGYGLHLVRVHERAVGGLPQLADVSDAVRREWHHARRREANAALHKRLREKYNVTVDWPKWARTEEPVMDAR